MGARLWDHAAVGSSHKVAGVAKAIEAVSATIQYLPPYSLGLNPIEMAFAKLRGHIVVPAFGRRLSQLIRPPTGNVRIRSQLRNELKSSQAYVLHVSLKFTPLKGRKTNHSNSPDSMSTFVPLISSGVAGPLGVLHLPRLWLKVSLEAQGKLAPGYPGVGKGFDAMTLGALGLDEQAVRDYIKSAKPSYPQFEAWVITNGRTVTPEAVAKHNAAVTGYHHDDATRQGILSASGLPDGSPKDAVNLNNLDDWYEFHQAVLK